MVLNLDSVYEWKCTAKYTGLVVGIGEWEKDNSPRRMLDDAGKPPWMTFYGVDDWWLRLGNTKCVAENADSTSFLHKLEKPRICSTIK